VQCACSLATLRRRHDWPVLQMRQNLPGMDGMNDKQRSRWAKTTMLDWTPWLDTLYLDADTRVWGDLSAGFQVLDDGWDLALTISDNQAEDWLWHIDAGERAQTREECGQMLQLQAGAFFVRRNRRTVGLWQQWATEWLRWGDEDQGAFLRALQASPVRLWLLGRPWNGGALVNHLYGRCRG